MSEAAAGTGSVVLENVQKRFGDTIALDGLSLTAAAGEIFGIAGPNGSGKSTMIKILAGEVEADAGRILFDGEERTDDDPARTVAIVHQEPQVFPNLTVAENILVGRERRRTLMRKVDDLESELLEAMGLAPQANRILGGLPLASQQRTEIARSLAQNARVFLFDEPNSALTDEESEDLFRRMHALADEGRVVILVSHRLNELVEHADRVAMLIDGRSEAEFAGEELTQDRLARELVVGAVQSEQAEAADVASHAGNAVMEVNGWTHPEGKFTDVSMQVGSGEIVAVTGVEGSGARELIRSLAGFAPSDGAIWLKSDDGRALDVAERAPEGGSVPDVEPPPDVASAPDVAGESASSSEAKQGGAAGVDFRKKSLGQLQRLGRISRIGKLSRRGSQQSLGRKGVAFVGADRAKNLFRNLSVGENLVARLTTELGESGILRPKTIRRHSEDLAEKFMVKTTSVAAPITSLSGGNQQKVVIASALATNPMLLILEEPTRGVDVPSKREIYRLLRQFVESGEGVLLYCTEDSEIFEVADRTVVIAKGRISGELTRDDYNDVESCAAARARLESV